MRSDAGWLATALCARVAHASGGVSPNDFRVSGSHSGHRTPPPPGSFSHSTSPCAGEDAIARRCRDDGAVRPLADGPAHATHGVHAPRQDGEPVRQGSRERPGMLYMAQHALFEQVPALRRDIMVRAALPPPPPRPPVDLLAHNTACGTAYAVQ